MSKVEMPRKNVPPPAELVKSRIEEALPPAVTEQVRAGDVAVVDTRDPDKFALGHIPGAVNVPAGENGVDAHAPKFAERIAEATEGKPPLLYCNSGNRSARATDALTNEHGVEGVRSLVGGIKLWDDLGYPVEGIVAADAEQADEAGVDGEG